MTDCKGMNRRQLWDPTPLLTQAVNWADSDWNPNHLHQWELCGQENKTKSAHRVSYPKNRVQEVTASLTGLAETRLSFIWLTDYWNNGPHKAGIPPRISCWERKRPKPRPAGKIYKYSLHLPERSEVGDITPWLIPPACLLYLLTMSLGPSRPRSINADLTSISFTLIPECSPLVDSPYLKPQLLFRVVQFSWFFIQSDLEDKHKGWSVQF